MIAAFWKHGKVTKFPCTDCQIMSQPAYTEVVIRDSLNETHMFVITNDPDIEATMHQAGVELPGIFDGFQLSDLEGHIIDKVSIFDSSTLH